MLFIDDRVDSEMSEPIANYPAFQEKLNLRKYSGTLAVQEEKMESLETAEPKEETQGTDSTPKPGGDAGNVNTTSSTGA